MDLVVRRATVQDAAAIAAVRIDSWRSTYRGIMPDTYLADMRVEDSTALWTRVLSAEARNAWVYVAEKADEVVGFAAGKMLEESRFGLDSELAAIYVRTDMQRMDIGHRLLSMVANAHLSHGATGVLVWVIAANKAARQFYEQLGAEFLIEQSFNWDGLDLQETGYGWRDLQALVASCNK